MKRELSITQYGEHFLLKFHNYMGPWEGHQIEHVLDLEEIEAPPDKEHDVEILGPGQAYLWEPMSFEPELHALVRADRLPFVASLVRDRDVTVLEGGELLPEPPATAHVTYDVHADDSPDGSYVALIEKRHESAWERGPRAVIGAFLLRAVPALIVIFAIVVWSRHMGDKYTEVPVNETFARASMPRVEQGFLAGLVQPDYSHLVRNEIRSVSFAHGDRMLLGDGSLVRFEGAQDVLPWLSRASMSRAAIVVDAEASDERVRVHEVRCGNEVLARDLLLQRVAKLPPGDSAPARADIVREADRSRQFRNVTTLPVAMDQDEALRALVGERVSLRGRLVREDGELVLRSSDGTGVRLSTEGLTPKARVFLDTFTDGEAPVVVDLQIAEVFPWQAGRAGGPQREGTNLAGRARVHSLSAQNYHVAARG